MTRKPVYRPWWEVRWRQLKNPPPPVFRAVVADVAVAIVLGLALLVYALGQPVGANLSGPVLLFAVAVITVGSALTYAWVELPTGASGVRRRSAWAAVLGLFAALPVVYLVVVLMFQVVRPLLQR